MKGKNKAVCITKTSPQDVCNNALHRGTTKELVCPHGTADMFETLAGLACIAHRTRLAGCCSISLLPDVCAATRRASQLMPAVLGLSLCLAVGQQLRATIRAGAAHNQARRYSTAQLRDNCRLHFSTCSYHKHCNGMHVLVGDYHLPNRWIS